MLRHGLYDVDRVISRTIAWLALSVVLVGRGGRRGAGRRGAPRGRLDRRCRGRGGGRALAFDPLRRRLQRVVDRRFDRDRARAVSRVEAFAARLRDGTAEPEGIEAVLRDALGDPGLRAARLAARTTASTPT